MGSGGDDLATRVGADLDTIFAAVVAPSSSSISRESVVRAMPVHIGPAREKSSRATAIGSILAVVLVGVAVGVIVTRRTAPGLHAAQALTVKALPPSGASTGD